MTKELRWKPSQKQKLAFDYLDDKTTTEIMYGGGAGGGKSYLGCIWLIYCCLHYPGSRWLMGRAVLKTLKQSTLLTFFTACKNFGLKRDVDYKYNQMEGVIKWTNESEIYLKDLFAYPSDPEFDELGSTEFTGAFIDEASQLTEKAYKIVTSRIRYKLGEFDLVPKILTCTNPTKNFLYHHFYKPSVSGTLEPYRRFIPALVRDNPYMTQHYIDNLNKLDNISRERLLHGNWEYDEDPTRLFEYEKILDMFDRPYEVGYKDQKYITADIARYGDDTTVVILWLNLYILKIYSFYKQGLKDTRGFIEKLAEENAIPRENIVLDEDGLGGGIVDEMKGVRGFVNNSKPLEKIGSPDSNNYQNLKSQCYFYLADLVNNGKIGIYSEVPIEAKEKLIADLEQIKRFDADKDGKLRVTPKEEIKLMLLRSPDYSDAMMMRVLLMLKAPYKPYIAPGPARRY